MEDNLALFFYHKENSYCTVRYHTSKLLQNLLANGCTVPYWNSQPIFWDILCMIRTLHIYVRTLYRTMLNFSKWALFPLSWHDPSYCVVIRKENKDTVLRVLFWIPWIWFRHVLTTITSPKQHRHKIDLYSQQDYSPQNFIDSKKKFMSLKKSINLTKGTLQLYNSILSWKYFLLRLIWQEVWYMISATVITNCCYEVISGYVETSFKKLYLENWSLGDWCWIWGSRYIATVE